ncbi:MAG: hypothetical protein SW833_06350 [Cyanobacteriota bacterium]|nr:hypothetical protein [Cyanobacteriota bacterium]
MNPFVGVSKQSLSVPQLLELIEQFGNESTVYFFRWYHQVSGFHKQLPKKNDFPMIEGQMFDREFELRWKYKSNGLYEVLLLSRAGEHSDFELVGNDWEIQDRNAYLYGSTETRFPNRFTFVDRNIAQRYFIDKQTATVRFIALTVT